MVKSQGLRASTDRRWLAQFDAAQLAQSDIGKLCMLNLLVSPAGASGVEDATPPHNHGDLIWRSHGDQLAVPTAGA